MKNPDSAAEVFLHLTIGSRGVAIGQLKKGEELIEQRQEVTRPVSFGDNSATSPRDEILKLRKAVESVTRDIKKVLGELTRQQKDSEQDKAKRQAADVLESHIIALNDSHFFGQIERSIQESKVSAKDAVNSAFQSLKKLFSNAQSYSRDFDDLRKSLLEYLGWSRTQFETKTPLVVIVKDLSAHMVARFARMNISGIVAIRSSQNSHEMILCRAMGIPALFGKKINLDSLRQTDEPVEGILDANAGYLILNPSSETLQRYKKPARNVLEKRNIQLKSMVPDLELLANINYSTELKNLPISLFSGIGLYRSEFMFLEETNHARLAQGKFYRRLLSAMPEKPPVIRLFDFTSDKVFTDLHFARNKMGPLGVRSIRYLQKKPEVLYEQLNCILKEHKKNGMRAKILIPMLSFVEELSFVMKILEQVVHEQKTMQPEIGVMIESRAAVDIMPFLNEQVDFYSVGTNDLLQYLLAIGRDEPEVSGRLNSLHESFLVAMQQILHNAQKIPVSICGESSSEPAIFPLLIALGYRRFSISPSRAAMVSAMLAKLTLAKCKKYLQEMRKLRKISDREVLAKTFIEEEFGDLNLVL